MIIVVLIIDFYLFASKGVYRFKILIYYLIILFVYFISAFPETVSPDTFSWS